jgi:ATP-dependent RNA helicase RhlE
VTSEDRAALKTLERFIGRGIVRKHAEGFVPRTLPPPPPPQRQERPQRSQRPQGQGQNRDGQPGRGRGRFSRRRR